MIVLTVLGAAAVGYASYSDYRATIGRAETFVADMSLVLEEHAGNVLSGNFDAIGQAVDVLDGGSSPERLATSVSRQRRALVALSAGGRYRVACVLDARGRVILSTGELPIDTDLSHREYFQQHRAGAAEVVGPLIARDPFGEPAFTVSRRLTDDRGQFSGAVAVGIATAEFTDFYRNLDLGPRGFIGLLRTDGRLLARHPAVDGMVGATLTPAGVARLTARPAGTYLDRSQLDGVERLHAFRTLKDLPVVVVVGVDWDGIIAQWKRRQLMLAAVVVPLALLLAGAAWYALRSMRREAVSASALVAALAEKEALLADKDMLLSEVHHRVKNNLQIIQSLLTMARLNAGEESQSGYDDSLERIQAMALVHELLYKSGDYGCVAIGDYLGRLARLLVGDRSDVALSIDADAAHLDLDRAVPFAMAVNEMVSNALKHGFAGGRGGRLDVTLRNGGGTVEVTVADDGPGLPSGFDTARPRSLGIRLLQGLAKQMGGAVRFESAGGTRVSLWFPA